MLGKPNRVAAFVEVVFNIKAESGNSIKKRHQIIVLTTINLMITKNNSEKTNELKRKTKATSTDTFLNMALRIGDNVLSERFHKGFFVPSKEHFYTRFDNLEPLVLLQLDATLMANRQSIPEVWPSESHFTASYRGREWAFDTDLIYTLKNTGKVPKSLEEAAALGEVEEARRMISEGADVNSRNRAVQTPLHQACKKGHREIVALLLANGADVHAGH